MSNKVMETLASFKAPTISPISSIPVTAAQPLRTPVTDSLAGMPMIGRTPTSNPTSNPTNVTAASAIPSNAQYDKIFGIASPILDKYGVKVSSGYRPNSKLRTSQHIGGNAMDIDISKLDTSTRRALIQDMQAAKFTGFGVGYNTLHADVGPKRHWTYNKKGDWISGMMPGYEDLFK